MSLSLDDIMEIHNALNAYGHVLDERRWSELETIFTDDVVFDFSDLGLEVIKGIDAVRSLFSGYANPPVAHHATNIVVTADGDMAAAHSKGLMLLPNGVLSSWIYRDRLMRTAYGWRIFHRVGKRLGLMP